MSKPITESMVRRQGPRSRIISYKTWCCFYPSYNISVTKKRIPQSSFSLAGIRFFIFHFRASFLPILTWCHLVVFFELAVKVGSVIKACLAGDFQYREIRVLQEFGCLAKAELNQVLNAGNAQMLLEEVHEMGGAVATDASQLVNI